MPVSSHFYIGAVALAIRMHKAMGEQERDWFDGDGNPMSRLAADFNAQELSLEMRQNGATWMLRDREPADIRKDGDR